jgi:hypothetical protein
MAIFDTTQGPVTVHSVEKGPLFEIFQARQGDKPAGAIRFDWTRQGAFLQTIVGHGHGAYVAPFSKMAEAALAHTGRLTFFTDFWEMTTYDSALRTGNTQFALKHFAKIDGSHVLVQSKLVAMGVSVGTLATNGLIKGYSKRIEFDILLPKHGLPVKRSMPT